MKPDWKDAPSWAKYRAMDENGFWYWYECEPFFNAGKWHAMLHSRVERVEDYKNSLEEKLDD